MESNRGESPQFEKPVVPVGAAEEGQLPLEVAPSSPETSPSKQAVAPPITQIVIQSTSSVQDDAVTDDDAQSSGSVAEIRPPASHNSDRIERQWVERAKVIVAETKTDPYKQKNEMSQVKAEYIQKRFNKVIKTSDSPVV